MSRSECESDFCVAPWFSALYPHGGLEGVEVVRLPPGEGLGDATALLKNGWGIQVVFEEKGRIARSLRLSQTLRRFYRAGVACEIVGLGGAVEKPRFAAPLRRPILRYVDSVAFRGSDSPARAFLKRLISSLPMPLVWQGPLVLVAAKSLEAFDRFVLLPDDRQISFLFRPDAATPWAVRKSGPPGEIDVERRNHERAVQLLGLRVPALLNADREEALTMEALPERLLWNVVAQAWFKRRAVFVREALRHLDFCLEVYRLLHKGASLDRAPVSAEEVAGLLEGVGQFLNPSSKADRLKEAFEVCIGSPMPRMAQHCDFCARNVLVVGGERDRVLIDWEDFQERCWPLADFSLLSLSLKEAYAGQFKSVLDAAMRHPDMVRGLKETQDEIAGLLELDERGMRQAKMLSLAWLCRQNLKKNRIGTARRVFEELERTEAG